MALDPTILQGIKLPSDYEAQRIKLGDAAVMAEHNQLKLDSEKKAVADQEMVSAIAKRHFNPETNEFDIDGFSSEYGTIDPVGAITMKAKYKEGVAEQRKKHFEAVGEELKFAKELLVGVKDQRTYDQALAIAKSRGVDTSTLPDVYVPDLIESMTYDVDTKYKELQALQKARDDERADEALANAQWSVQTIVGEDGVTPVLAKVNKVTGEVVPLAGPDGAPVGAIPKGTPAGTGKLSSKDREGLISGAKTASQLVDLIGRFDPSFGGKKVLGKLDVEIASRIPLSEKDRDYASFWKDMKGMDNVIRNSLFGGALTETERREWELATVTPDMDPKIIERNLKTRLRLYTIAMARTRDSLIAGGTNPDAVDAAIGSWAGTLDAAKARRGGVPAVKKTSAAGSSRAREIADLRAEGATDEEIAEIMGQ